MTAFTVGQIAIGGKHGYVEVIDADGTFSQMVPQLDDFERLELNVMGVTFNQMTGDMYTALTPDPTMPYTPHDIAWLPDNSGLLVALVPSQGTLWLRKYDFDGNPLGQAWTNLETDQLWRNQPVKIDVACDSRTVYYTDSGRTIFRYDLVSGQLAHYQQLPTGSQYVYGAVRLTNGGTVVVAAMSRGPGPRRAIAVNTGEVTWADEPISGQWKAVKRAMSNGAALVSVLTKADLGTTNAQSLSMASYWSPCDEPPLIGAAKVWYRADLIDTCDDCDLVAADTHSTFTMNNATGWLLHNDVPATSVPLLVCEGAGGPCSPSGNAYDVIVNTPFLPDADAYLQLRHDAASGGSGLVPAVRQPALTTSSQPPVMQAANDPELFDAAVGWTVFLAVRFNQGAVGTTSTSIFDGEVELLFNATPNPAAQLGLAIGRGSLDGGPVAIAQHGGTVLSLPVLGLVGHVSIFVVRYDPTGSILTLAERCSGQANVAVASPPAMCNGLELLKPATALGYDGRYAAEKDFFEMIVYAIPVDDEVIEGELTYLADRYGAPDCPQPPDPS